MNNNGNATSIKRDIAITVEKILNQCEKVGTKEEKITYLKKIMNDCQRIINLAETIDGKVLDVDFLLKVEQDIDEYLIMFLDGLCKQPLSLPARESPLTLTETTTGGQEKIPLVVRQPRKYYDVSITVGGRVCDIQSAFDGMKSFMESIKEQTTDIGAVGKNAGDTIILTRMR